jgi:hypothetical protein
LDTFSQPYTLFSRPLGAIEIMNQVDKALLVKGSTCWGSSCCRSYQAITAVRNLQWSSVGVSPTNHPKCREIWTAMLKTTYCDKLFKLRTPLPLAISNSPRLAHPPFYKPNSYIHYNRDPMIHQPSCQVTQPVPLSNRMFPPITPRLTIRH